MKQTETHTYHYLTVEESIRQNGHRHLERTISYISAGYPDRFADSSLRKAIKNFKRADEIKIQTPDWFVKYLGMMEDKIAAAVAKNIMNGMEGNHFNNGLLTGILYYKIDENGNRTYLNSDKIFLK